MYQYGILRRDLTDEAARHNAEWLGENTLGIEVTDESLAQGCGFGNIDPQHQINSSSSSAIEDAMSHSLPPQGTKLVTIRPDKDSVGAMAVLTLRAMGRDNAIDRILVSWVGAIDRCGYTNALKRHPDLAEYFEDNTFVEVLNVISLQGAPRWPSITERVKDAMKVLTGEMSWKEAEEIKALYSKRRMNFDPQIFGEVGYLSVSGALEMARNWANSKFPVAVIYDDAHHSQHGGQMKKLSIVRQPGRFDRRGFEEAVNKAEAEARGLTVEELKQSGLTWGGNQNIVSSPAGIGRDTYLKPEVVVGLVRNHLESGVVT